MNNYLIPLGKNINTFRESRPLNAFIIVVQQPQCFNALLIFESICYWAKTDPVGCTHVAIYTCTKCLVRLCTQIPTVLYTHGRFSTWITYCSTWMGMLQQMTKVTTSGESKTLWGKEPQNTYTWGDHRFLDWHLLLVKKSNHLIMPEGNNFT